MSNLKRKKLNQAKKRIFPEDRIIKKAEIYSYLVNNLDSEGLGLTARDAAHLIGSLERDMSNYSKAEVSDIEDNFGRSLLVRLIERYPELADHLKTYSFSDVFEALSRQSGGVVDFTDIAVLVGTTRQNSWRWKDLESGSGLRPLTQALFRTIIVLEREYGKEGIDSVIELSKLEHKLRDSEDALRSL